MSGYAGQCVKLLTRCQGKKQEKHQIHGISIDSVEVHWRFQTQEKSIGARDLRQPCVRNCYTLAHARGSEVLARHERLQYSHTIDSQRCCGAMSQLQKDPLFIA